MSKSRTAFLAALIVLAPQMSADIAWISYGIAMIIAYYFSYKGE